MRHIPYPMTADWLLAFLAEGHAITQVIEDGEPAEYYIVVPGWPGHESPVQEELKYGLISELLSEELIEYADRSTIHEAYLILSKPTAAAE